MDLTKETGEVQDIVPILKTLDNYGDHFNAHTQKEYDYTNMQNSAFCLYKCCRN